VSALLHFGLNTIGADAKDANRDLIMSGGPWSDEEKERIGDPYLAFAILAGAAPESATKKSHSEIRNLYKRAILAMEYGMGYKSLALQLGILPLEAREIIAQHKRVYATYWAWLDRQYDLAVLWRSITTTFGWRLKIEAGFNGRSIEKFPMQANGAELRLACSLATESGVKIAAPVHDAILIAAPNNELHEKKSSNRSRGDARGIAHSPARYGTAHRCKDHQGYGTLL
jgi:hypothetical protein